MSQTVNNEDRDRERKIAIAACYKTEKETPEFGDMSYGAFIGVMLHRREIAKHYLRETESENKKMLAELFEDCNNKIRLILGL